MFSHEICNICIFNRTPPDDVSFENIGFFRIFFYRAPPGNCLLHVQVAEFQPAYTVKSYFRGTFQAFYTRTRSNYSKAFIYLKSMKIIFEEDNLQWSCKIPNCKFTKKNSFTHPASCILPSFSQNASELHLLKEALKVCELFFFQEI